MRNEKKNEKFKRSLFHKIVNFFIGITAFLLFLLIIFFGFSQTKTFRDYLKDKITTNLNESLDANLHIESLEGSVLTSIILKNTSLTTSQDTLLKANEIVLKTSPVHLFLKRILIRDFIIRDASFRILEDKNGLWNISKLSNSKNEKDSVLAEEDNSNNSFPFSIQINNLKFDNVSFIKQTYEHLNSSAKYKFLNQNDIQLNKIFLNAKLFANINSKTVRLSLNNLSASPNFNSFNLKKLSGEFEFTPDYAKVSNLVIATDSSRLNITAQIDELNLLGGVKLKNFKEYPTSLSFEAYPLTFSDLYTFIDDIDFLDGKVHFDLKADGYFGDFNIKSLKMAFLNSYLSMSGKVKKLHTPKKLFLDVKIQDSKIVESDAHRLVKGLSIPNYDNLILENLNVSFKGEPTLFHTVLDSKVNDGRLYLDTYLDLQNDEMEYDIEFNSSNINLFPILQTQTSLTSSGKIRGTGTDPNAMDAFLKISANNSSIDSIAIDSLYLSTEIKSKLLDLDFSGKINDAKTTVFGKLDLTNSTEPIYNVYGNILGLNLSNFTKDENDNSNLNFSYKANGKNLELNDMVGDYSVTLEPSYLRKLYLDETSILLSLKKDNNQRNIKLNSEFVDFNIDGQFSLSKAIEIIAYESSTISTVINHKIEELNPIENKQEKVDSLRLKIPQIVNEDLEFNFNFTFKDFDLIAEFLKNDELDITGYGDGSVTNDSLNFKINTEVFIENLLNKKKDNIIYISNLGASLNFSRDNKVVSFNKMFGSASIEGEKIYAGVNINDLYTDIVFNQSKLFFNTELKLNDNIYTEFEGIASTSRNNEKILLSNINLNYKNIPWQNYDTTSVIFDEIGMQISNLVLLNGASVIEIDGQINNDKSHNLIVNIEDMPGEVVSAILLDKENQNLGGDLNLTLSSSGLLDNPKIDLVSKLNNISFNNVRFGSLFCNVNHFNQKSIINIDFLNSKLNESAPLFSVDANIPFHINFLDTLEVLNENDELIIDILSENFNLATFGSTLPYINNQTGFLNSKIKITGTTNNLLTNGFLNIDKLKFTSRDNNLDYISSISMNFNNQLATVEKFFIANAGGSKFSGKVDGNGTIELKRFPFNKFDLNFSGNLALLGKKSETRKSIIYGDLLVKSKNGWEFTYRNNTYKFSGDVVVERGNLFYSADQNNKNLSNRKVIYKIIEDTTKVNLVQKKFVRVLNETNKHKRDILIQKPINLKLNTNILIDNIASLTFIVSPQLNQKLYVETTGQLELETVGNELKAQGNLALLSGSRLDFFKTFDAQGTIRFEGDITDPHFDIVATYIGEVSDFEGQGTAKDVAVKLKLNTPFSKLQQSISQNNNNLTVYVGREDIENDIPAPEYDQSNALTFIILDQLSLDLNASQRSTLTDVGMNTAYSLLGSQLTNYINSVLGTGLINSIRLNKYSGRDAYKLLFSGRYNNIRYSFGGSFGSQTDYLQLSNADIKVEYLFNPNLLLRVQQKSPVIETTTDEKIQELGLKYKLEF